MLSYCIECQYKKSYMQRRFAQQLMPLSDLEWPFHSSSVWEGRANVKALLIVHTKINIIRIARYLCRSWACCLFYNKAVP